MQALLWPLVSWMFREVLVKFVILGAIFLTVQALMPLVSSAVAGISPASITNTLTALGPSFSYFAYKFGLDYSVPLILSAHATAFTIRRIPVIG